MILRDRVTSSDSEINLSNQPAGTYLIKIVN
ncbi:hypothetical protein [Aurantibacillus circumpalustris]